ncbi:phage major capsid protein [Sulfitobacter sp. M57]|uniref:phage major capsid protein n=1 Tax=unclassified Sulfitobacter TaxID=196795 RepID=UPI0023E32864|nr:MULTISPECIES: phage major capsid protein [unclassified Sulfitobacter]MDF3413280.1 phage major capsid protein [Sulfitobacter sp. KE5]MDF3421440.1 phage major capsid protein [Sulfitobacter sp. KE43]MDF3431827.1 phage major capsid protein [Sulfitobacter sp. KE42]MDF3457467.1 phage major capsid protein [Sulfitobacter sp. S74]MDF3461369.1 phage major capsid protein [Sulfitobacter sp. Ks18]
MTLKEMIEKRAKLIKDARSLLTTAKDEKRSMTDDETTQYDKMFAEADELRQTIEREQRQREVERELSEAAEAEEERNGSAGGDGGERRDRADKLLDTLRSFLTTGQVSGEGAQEFRDLSAGVNTEGGFLVMPETFVNLLIKAMDDEVVIRKLANVIPMTQAASIGIPTLDADPEDADWTTELSTGGNDSGMGFGKRVMMPHPMAKRIKISQQLLRTAALAPETLVRQRLGYKFGITQEKSYMIGNGDKKPLGCFVASKDGIPASRDVSEDNTTTEVTAKGLISAKYSLKAGYWANSNWLFHRDTMKQIAKLTDADGQFIWRESMRDGEPDRLLGRPSRMSEFVPNTIGAGNYVGLLGDFSHYWILDSLVMQIQRLTELYAETNQVGFIGRYEGDGAPVLAEAFARVKLAAA